MKYELAKKLKDAGLKIESDFGYVYLEPWQGATHIYDLCCDPRTDGKDYVYAPTLSELIEACGDVFNSLNRQKLINKWYVNFDREYDYEPESEGDTPEEAVANLWLKLNPIR